MKLTDAIAICVLLQLILYMVSCTIVIVDDPIAVVPVELEADFFPRGQGSEVKGQIVPNNQYPITNNADAVR